MRPQQHPQRWSTEIQCTICEPLYLLYPPSFRSQELIRSEDLAGKDSLLAVLKSHFGTNLDRTHKVWKRPKGVNGGTKKLPLTTFPHRFLLFRNPTPAMVHYFTKLDFAFWYVPQIQIGGFWFCNAFADSMWSCSKAWTNISLLFSFSLTLRFFLLEKLSKQNRADGVQDTIFAYVMLHKLLLQNLLGWNICQLKVLSLNLLPLGLAHCTQCVRSNPPMVVLVKFFAFGWIVQQIWYFYHTPKHPNLTL